MKIGLSFVTLAGSAMLVLLSVSPAQARIGKSQKSAALGLPAGASFKKQSQGLAKQLQTPPLTIHQQQKTISGIQPTSPWYAYDAALRAAAHQRQQTALKAAEHQQQKTISGIQPTSPWYAYDAALRAAAHQRQEQRVG
jgi:hypothetical protein